MAVLDPPNNPPDGPALVVAGVAPNRLGAAGPDVVDAEEVVVAGFPNRPPEGAALVVAGRADPKRPPLGALVAGCADDELDWKRLLPVPAPDVAAVAAGVDALEAGLFRLENRLVVPEFV